MNKLHLYILMCTLLSTTIASRAQDSTKLFKHNLNFHPTLEGVIFKYEHPFKSKSSIKFGFVLRESDDFSFVNGMNAYKEQQVHFQYRNYFNKNKGPMHGLYHGLQLVAKKINGEVSFFDFRRNEQVAYENKALGFGYVLGYQKMTKSGFNFDLGYALKYNMAQQRSFDAYFLDLIPYKPYNTGIYTQLYVGIGLAF